MRKFSFEYEQVETVDTPLLQEAQYACQRAYAPYSEFRVGAAILLENGVIITGNNQENGAYPSGLCAERVAAFAASSQYPNMKFLELLIVAHTQSDYLKEPVSPCGACRQVLWEYESKQNAPIKTYLYGKAYSWVVPSVKSLLPFAFEL